MQTLKTFHRQISKIYPPQLSQSNNSLILYNPLEQWIESHTSSSLKDLIEIQNQLPLYLNNSSDQIIMQSKHDVFLESEPNQWMSKIQKRMASQKQIVSQTIRHNQMYLNINDAGQINVWNASTLIGENLQFCNPQSHKNIQKNIQLNEKVIETSINSYRLVRQYRHGYSFAQIAKDSQNIYTLHEFQGDNIFRKILKTSVSDSQGQSVFLSCFLPNNISKILHLNSNFFAYGGQNALLIDTRTESIVCDFNNEEGSQIKCIKQMSDNILYVGRGKNVLLIDLRNPGQLLNKFDFDDKIDVIELFSQNQKNYCGVSFNSSKVIVAEL